MQGAPTSRLILASRSPDRLWLLREAGYEVEAVPSNVAEPDPTSFGDLETGLSRVAQHKARSVARGGARGLILAADTVGLVAGEVFGKPADREDARRMLTAISGTAHEVLTGWCLLRTADGAMRSGVERTRIMMRRWTEAELDNYLAGGEWQGRSGAYALQLPTDPFVECLEGSHSNVIGLPLERLRQVLAELSGSV